MKTIMGFMAIIVITLTACQKETESTEQFDSAVLELNSNVDTELSGNDIAYDPAGRHKHKKDTSCRRIPLDLLSQLIKDYIASNYPGALIEVAFTDRKGNFYTIIKLTDGAVKILQFDSNGNFVKELEKKHRGPKDPRKRLTKVDPSDLLPDIVSYIDLNYPGATLIKAGTTASGEFVVFLNWNGTRKAILFDASGSFIKELK